MTDTTATSAKTGLVFGRLYPWLVVVFLIAWRLLRYLLQFPVWGDEAMLCLNFLDHGYHALTRTLEHGQVAPLLVGGPQNLLDDQSAQAVANKGDRPIAKFG